MSEKTTKTPPKPRRVYDEAFKRRAVQMLLDGHSASSVAERLGLSGINLLHRWRRQQVGSAGPIAEALDDRVQALERELQRVQREREILEKALVVFGRPK